METGDEDDDLEEDDVFVDVIVVVIVFVDVGDGVIALVGKEDLLKVVVLVEVFDCVAVEEGLQKDLDARDVRGIEGQRPDVFSVSFADTKRARQGVQTMPHELGQTGGAGSIELEAEAGGDAPQCLRLLQAGGRFAR